MSNSRKTIFFDLDNTLVDHTFAQRSALGDVYNRHRAVFHQIQCEDFIQAYTKVNDRLWKALGDNEITIEELRIQSFMQTLQQLFSLTPLLKYDFRDAFDMPPYYRAQYETYTRENAGATKVLNALSDGYSLGVISNGFTTIQNIKLDQLGWRKYFSHIVLSEEVGAMKPHAAIFDAAMLPLQCAPDEVTYVGDSFVNDIAAAKRQGWNTIWYNPDGDPPPNGDAGSADLIIRSLEEIPQAMHQLHKSVAA